MDTYTIFQPLCSLPQTASNWAAAVAVVAAAAAVAVRSLG